MGRIRKKLMRSYGVVRWHTWLATVCRPGKPLKSVPFATSLLYLQPSIATDHRWNFFLFPAGLATAQIPRLLFPIRAVNPPVATVPISFSGCTAAGLRPVLSPFSSAGQQPTLAVISPLRSTAKEASMADGSTTPLPSGLNFFNSSDSLHNQVSTNSTSAL